MAVRRKAWREDPPRDDGSPAGPQRRRPGRPPVYDEEWTKVTVVLFDRQIALLDALTEAIRIKKGVSISRAQLIRAVVDAVGEAGIDLTTCSSTADVKAVLLSRLSAQLGSGSLAGERQEQRHDHDRQDRQR